MYPPVRQFEQYEFARHLREMSRAEAARPERPLSTWQRAWLAVAVLLVLAAIVASYVVAVSTSLHL